MFLANPTYVFQNQYLRRSNKSLLYEQFLKKNWPKLEKKNSEQTTYNQGILFKFMTNICFDLTYIN